MNSTTRSHSDHLFRFFVTKCCFFAAVFRLSLTYFPSPAQILEFFHTMTGNENSAGREVVWSPAGQKNGLVKHLVCLDWVLKAADSTELLRWASFFLRYDGLQCVLGCNRLDCSVAVSNQGADAAGCGHKGRFG